MQIKTEVFKKLRENAIETIADAMQESYRFGFLSRNEALCAAERRYKARCDGKPWNVNLPLEMLEDDSKDSEKK